jgi:membrane associated rhomboid family serine protease
MYITYLLLAVTVLVSVKAFSDESWKRQLMFNPYDVVHNQKWYRSFTHAFVHANWMHLGFNMYVLYVFGVASVPKEGWISSHYSLEPTLVMDHGAKGYLFYGCLYLGGILFSTLWSMSKHKDNPAYNSLGASGAVYAVVFASIMMNPNMGMGIIFIPIFIPAYIFGPLLLVAEYYLAKRGGTAIGHDAHISGAIFGMIFICVIDYNYLLDFFSKLVA